MGLTVTDSRGLTVQATPRTIRIHARPTAAFDVSPAEPVVGQRSSCPPIRAIRTGRWRPRSGTWTAMAPSTTRRERAWWGLHHPGTAYRLASSQRRRRGPGDRLEDHQRQGLQLARPDHPRRRREAKLAAGRRDQQAFPETALAVPDRPHGRLAHGGRRAHRDPRREGACGVARLAVCRGKKCPVKKKIMAVSTKKPRPVRLKRFERFFPAGSVIEVFVRRTDRLAQVHPFHDPIKAPAVEAHGRLRGAQHHPCVTCPAD